MSHWPRNLEDVFYRIARLRRLTAICMLVVVIAAIAAASLYGGSISLSALFVWLGVFVLYGVLFPAGYLELTAISLSVALCYLTYPAIYGWAGANSQQIGTAMVLIPLVSFFVLLLALALSHGRFPRREIHRSASFEFPLSAETAAQRLFSDDRSDRLTIMGEEDSDGLIPVWFDCKFPDPEKGFEVSGTPAPQAREPDYFLKVLHAEPLCLIEQCIMPGRAKNGSPFTSVSETRVIPTGPESCRVDEKEVHNLWDWHTSIAAWATDTYVDHFHSELGDLTGSRARALKSLPQVTVLSLIAKAMAASELAPPNSTPS